MATRQPRYHSLRLQELVLWVHLGCTAEERAVAQEVRATIEFRFAQTPPALHSDRLEDTICYARVSSAVQELVQSHHYNVIERLAAEIYQVAIQTGPEADVGVRVHKVRPPVERLSGGAAYSCGDFPL